MLIWTECVLGPFQEVDGGFARQNKVHKFPGQCVVRCAKVDLQIVWRRTLDSFRPFRSHVRPHGLTVLELCPVTQPGWLLDARGHVPILPLFALQVAHQFQVAHDGEILSAQIHHLLPAHVGLDEVPHAVYISLQAGKPGVGHCLAAAGEESVWEAADEPAHSRLVGRRRLGVHVDAVDVLRHVNGSEQANEEL